MKSNMKTKQKEYRGKNADKFEYLKKDLPGKFKQKLIMSEH